MNGKSIAEVSKDTLMIEAVLKELPHGAYISYDDLANKSSVPMNCRGKSLARSAFRRLKIEFKTRKNEGYELEGQHNQTAFLADGVIKMDRSIKRTCKKFREAPEKPYFKDQTMEDKTFILSAGSVLQTLAEGSKKTKVFFPKPPTKRISN